MLNAPNTNAPAKQIHDDKTSRVRERTHAHVHTLSLSFALSLSRAPALTLISRTRTHSRDVYDAQAERGSGDKAWHTLLDM